MFQKDALVLDLGSYEFKGIFYDENSGEVIEERAKNTGTYNGYVNNVFLFQSCVIVILRAVEKKIGRKITNIIILVSGSLLEYKTLSVPGLSINGVIDQYKINKIDVYLKNWTEERKSIMLKAFPVEYVLDGCVVENPYGLYVNVFSFKYFVCYADKIKINNLIYILEQLHLNVLDVLPSIFVLGDYYLTEDERRLGSLIFDVGHSKIHWAYYYKGLPLKAGNINVGSDMLTSKLACSLKVSLNEAMRIKHEFICSTLKPEHFCAWVNVMRELNEDFILQAEIVRKILPDINAFLDEIKVVLDGFSKQKAYSAVLCGNGAYLGDLMETLQHTQSVKLKIARKDAVFGLSEIFFKNLMSQKNINKLFKLVKRFLSNFVDL